MLLDSDNEHNEEISPKGETFVEEKWLQLTEQDTWNTHSYAIVKVYLKEKRRQILLHMETLPFGSQWDQKKWKNFNFQKKMT